MRYCDIPYSNTNAYGTKNKNSFDYQRFYKWCSKQNELVMVSEYDMPEDFISVDEIEKSVLLNSGANLKATEKLFIPKHQIGLYESIKPKKWIQQEFDFDFEFEEAC